MFNDSRGYFFESFNKKKYKKIISENLIQDNHSFSKKNVLRGIHFQYKKPQSQLFYLVTGKIFVCFIDFRLKSKTFLKKQYITLDSAKHEQIYMSAGLGSGFVSLSSNIHLLYKVSMLYSPKNEMGIRWNDPFLKIKWPCEKPLISKKDLTNPFIKDLNFDNYNDLKIL